MAFCSCPLISIYIPGKDMSDGEGDDDFVVGGGDDDGDDDFAPVSFSFLAKHELPSIHVCF